MRIPEKSLKRVVNEILALFIEISMIFNEISLKLAAYAILKINNSFFEWYKVYNMITESGL